MKMATEKKVAPYGMWDSQISIDHVSGASNLFTEVHFNVSLGFARMF